MIKRGMRFLAKILPTTENSENALGVKCYSSMLKLKQFFNRMLVFKKSKWPVVNGNYLVGNPSAQLAVCTLTSENLKGTLFNWDLVAISGSLYTPNLGIESIILNTISNPNIRYLVVCGKDSPIFQAGQALRCLFDYGINPDKRIINATGHYPVLLNLSIEKIQHFLKQIILIDYREELDMDLVFKNIQLLEKKEPFISWPSHLESKIKSEEAAFVPLSAQGKKNPIAYDEKGFFVISINRVRNEIIVKHYYADNQPGFIVRSHSSEAIIRAIIGNKLISQMSHAAYLGTELAKAKIALKYNFCYIQDQPLKNN